MPDKRCQPPEEDMVDPVKGAGLFEGHEISRLLDHADRGVIAARVAADGTERLVGLGEMEAHLAVLDLLLGGPNRVGQFEGFFRRTPKT